MKVEFLAVFAYVAAALTWNARSLHCTHRHITGTEKHNDVMQYRAFTPAVSSLGQNTMLYYRKLKL